MPRTLGSPKNLMLFDDNLSDSKLGLFYRMPDTEEIINYNNELVIREGDEIKRNHTAARIKYGQKILVGVQDGSFDKFDGKGGKVLISSDPGSEDFDKNWKDIVCKDSLDLIEILAIRVFETSASPAKLPKEDISGNLPATSQESKKASATS